MRDVEVAVGTRGREGEPASLPIDGELGDRLGGACGAQRAEPQVEHRDAVFRDPDGEVCILGKRTRRQARHFDRVDELARAREDRHAILDVHRDRAAAEHERGAERRLADIEAHAVIAPRGAHDGGPIFGDDEAAPRHREVSREGKLER